MVATPDGRGYWEVASDGGIFTFGDAVFEGSEGGQHLSAPVVGMAITPHGKGYWEVASDGNGTTFGDAVAVGSPPSVPPRVALFGDSLANETGEDFSSLAQAAGGTAFVRAFPGTAPCDWLPQMPADDAAFQPTAVVLLFSGDYYTPCISGYPFGSPQYYAKYQTDIQAVIDLFRADGAHVYLVGLPYDESPTLSANVANLNQLYISIAAANTGVDYVDAGQSVMAYGSSPGRSHACPSSPAPAPQAQTWSAGRTVAFLPERGLDPGGLLHRVHRVLIRSLPVRNGHAEPCSRGRLEQSVRSRRPRHDSNVRHTV